MLMLSHDRFDPTHTRHRFAGGWPSLMAALVGLIACFFVIQPSQFIDPFVYGDDLAWEVDPSFYYTKLRQEGRWLVFGWISAFGHGSAAFDYAATIVLWCATALLLAVVSSGHLRQPLVLVFAAALAINPSMWALTLWPHTTLPMVAILAAGALRIALASSATTRLHVLFLVMVATVLSYQLFSFYLLGAVMIASILRQTGQSDGAVSKRFVVQIATLGAVGAAGMLTGVLVQFSLNAAKFGHFGLAEARWRSNEAAALAAGNRMELAIANFQANLAWLNDHTSGQLWLVGVLAVIALLLVLRESQRKQRQQIILMLSVVAAIGAAPLLIPLATGVPLPVDRGSLNLWLALVATLMLALTHAANRTSKWLALSGMALLLAGTTQALSLASAGQAASWRQNQQVLDQLETAVRAAGPGEAEILVVGRPQLFDGPAGDAPWLAAVLLQHRLHAMGRSVSYCRSITSCSRFPLSRGKIEAMPIFPAPSAIDRRNRLLILKIGSVAE